MSTTAFGRECITSYVLFKLVKEKLPNEIKYEVDKMLQPDQINCNWKIIEDTITVSWTNNSRRPNGYYSRVTNAVSPSTNDTELVIHAALHPPAHDSLQDIPLKCERFNEDGSIYVCREDFIFITTEQLRYQKLGFKNQPKSCKKHRGQPPPNGSKVDANSKCAAGGDCSYGDKCILIHIEQLTDYSAAPTDDEPDEYDSNVSVYSW